jgi:RNA polymerase sigma factor (sigma-70 family)
MKDQNLAVALRQLGLERTVVERTDRYLRYLLRHATRRQDVDDLVQEVFLRVLQAEKPLPANPTEWVVDIARKVLRKRMEARKRSVQSAVIAAMYANFMPDVAAGPEEAGAIVERHLRQAMQELPPREASVLTCMNERGLSVEETARALAINPSIVRKLRSRAMYRLRMSLAAPNRLHFAEAAAGGGSRSAAHSDALPDILPVAVYLEDGSHAGEIMRRLEAFLGTFDLLVERRLPPIIGSFFGRFWVRAVDAQTAEELKKKLQKIELALETQQIAKPQSEVELNHAHAAAALLTAIGQESKSVALQVGNLLCLILVDEQGHKHARVLTLTPQQCAMIQENQDLLRHPDTLLKQISANKTGT